VAPGSRAVFLSADGSGAVSTTPSLRAAELPSSLVGMALDGAPVQQRLEVDGRVRQAVAVAVPELDGVYVGLFPLLDLDEVLDVLSTVLVATTALATLLAAAVGRWAAQRTPPYGEGEMARTSARSSYRSGATCADQCATKLSTCRSVRSATWELLRNDDPATATTGTGPPKPASSAFSHPRAAAQALCWLYSDSYAGPCCDAPASASAGDEPLPQPHATPARVLQHRWMTTRRCPRLGVSSASLRGSQGGLFAVRRWHRRR